MTDTVRTRRAKRKTKGPQMTKKGTVSKLILQAVAATHERRGLSLVGVKKMLSGSGYDVTKNNSRINHAVRTLMDKGSLVNVTGTGASGSFKLSKEQKDVVQRVERKVLVPGAAATKKPRGKHAAKRPAPAKKPRRKGPSRRRMKDGHRKLAKGGRKLKNAPRTRAARKGEIGNRQRTKPRKPTRPLKKTENDLAETLNSEKGNQAGSVQQEST
ncbi:histone H1-like [Rhinoraja longicauda]